MIGGISLLHIFIIVIVLLIIYYAFLHKNDNRKREIYEELYNTSRGDFDNNAEEAINTINKINERTPLDEYRAGNIIEYNILQGHIDRRTQPNRMPLDAMLVRYTRAIGDIGRQRELETTIVRGGRPRNNTFADATIVTMVNHIDEIVERIFNEIDDPNEIEIGFMTVAANNTPEIRTKAIDERKKNAEEDAETKEEYIDKYLTSSKTHNSDPQNVHDSTVNVNLRETVNIIKSTCISQTPERCIDEARTYAKGNSKEDLINQALDVIAQGGYNGTLEESEKNIFMYVWERSKLRANEKNKKNIQDSVINALADCHENGGVVCMNGRCGRLLESLTLLDYDENVGKAQTVEMIRNNIFDEVRKMIEQEIDYAKGSSDPLMQNIGQYYAGDLGIEPDKYTETEFKKTIENKIDIILGQYSNKLSKVQLDSLKEECLAVIN
jgi:hypothetical protein